MKHDCPNCAELRARIAWLEDELGGGEIAAVTDRLRDFMLTAQKNHNSTSRSQGARLVAALYGARGRVMSRWQLMEAIPPKHGGDDDRDAKIVDVWVCFARRAFGRDAIKNVWGVGFQLTPAGIAKVASIIEEPRRPAQEAA